MLPLEEGAREVKLVGVDELLFDRAAISCGELFVFGFEVLSGIEIFHQAPEHGLDGLEMLFGDLVQGAGTLQVTSLETSIDLEGQILGELVAVAEPMRNRELVYGVGDESLFRIDWAMRDRHERQTSQSPGSSGTSQVGTDGRWQKSHSPTFLRCHHSESSQTCCWRVGQPGAL